MYPIDQPKVYTQEEIKKMRQELAILQMPILVDGDPKQIMEAKRKKEQRIAELEKKLGSRLYPSFWEIISDFFQKKDKKQIKIPVIFTMNEKKLPDKSSKNPQKKKELGKIEALEKKLADLYRKQSPAIKYIIDPGTSLKWEIDYACIDAGLPPRYHTKKEMEQAGRVSGLIEVLKHSTDGKNGLKRRLKEGMKIQPKGGRNGR